MTRRSDPTRRASVACDLPWVAPPDDPLATPLPCPSPSPASSAYAFQLRRWPPSPLLRKDALRVELASLLLDRPMTVNDLSKLSQQPKDDCARFVSSLKAMHLIEVYSPGLRHSAAQQGMAPARRPTPPPCSLLERIRRRLGF